MRPLVILVLIVPIVAGSSSCKKEPRLPLPSRTATPSAVGAATVSTRAPAAPRPKAVPPPAAGKGNLSGVVQFDGKPVANIEVKLCQTFTSIGFGGCGGAVHLAKTDADGNYVLRDLPPGVYQALLVRLFDSTTWVYASADILRARAYTLVAGSTVEGSPTILYKRDLHILGPRPGVRVAGAAVEVRWAAYPGAAHYLVSLEPEFPLGATPDFSRPRWTSLKTEKTSFVADKPLPPGRYRSLVVAAGSSARNPRIAESDWRTFIVGEPVAAARDDAPAPSPLPTLPTFETFRPAPGTGAVQGLVLYNARGVPGIEVKLCELFDRYFRGCHGKVRQVQTDASGMYLFKDLPPMVYKGLTARVFKTKLVVFMTTGFAGLTEKSYPVEAGKTLLLPPTTLYKNDVRVLSPRARASLASTFELRWAPYPEAAAYSFSISSDYSAKGPRPTRIPPYSSFVVDQPSFVLDYALEPGAYTLTVNALNAWGQKLADSPSVAFAVK